MSQLFLSVAKYCLFLAMTVVCCQADDWRQGSGPTGDFQTDSPVPTKWSVVSGEKVAWTLSLPETGQSTPVICEGKVFLTTLKPVEADSELGKDLIAWCCDAVSGEVLWKRELIGKHPLRLSGCFSDSSSPPAVTDGKHVVFINASSGISCFTLAGELVWFRDFLSVGRCVPFAHRGKLIFTRQIYPPEANGAFPHRYADSPKEMWTQLQAVEIESGKLVWTTECGINMGVAVTPQQLNDGRSVVVAGRGGGHGPPEKPSGVSLVDLEDGTTIWTLEIEKFFATQTFGIRDDLVHLFHASEHLSVDAKNGQVVQRIPLDQHLTVRRSGRPEITKQDQAVGPYPGRNITQTSNLLVGPWNYFRHYKQPWIGRVNVESKEVEFLEVPLQLSRVTEMPDELLWFDPSKKRIESQTLIPNDMRNSRGFVVYGDKRSKGSGWGHIAAASPTVAGPHLYIPVINGTVYVLKWDSEQLDDSALVSINDLGLAGESYHRASLSFSNGRLYAHTIKSLICISD